MKEAGLDPAPSILVKPPRVKASPCAMECRWLQTMRLDDLDGKATQRYVVFGQVIGVHIDDCFMKITSAVSLPFVLELREPHCAVQ
jgi:flavin reductase (DIM6/NTAB) family NADH-FMN oxidoreductase RutF